MFESHFQKIKQPEATENKPIECYGTEFCGGTMSVDDVYDATKYAFHTMENIDPELISNLSQVPLYFIKGRSETILFSVENAKISLDEKRTLWQEVAPKNLNINAETIETFVPVKIFISEGDDAQTRTLFYRRGETVVPLGSLIAISDIKFQAMPENFRQDPSLKKAYEYICMITLLVHEGYHLGQEHYQKAKKEQTIQECKNNFPNKPKAETDAYKKEIAFLEKAGEAWSLRDNVFIKDMLTALEYILVEERKELATWEGRGTPSGRGGYTYSAPPLKI